jgi:hypothetical protein
MYAANGKLSATDGKTRWRQVPHPLMGNHRNQTANTINNTTPMTNDGRLIPTMAIKNEAPSIHDRGRMALSTPAVNPIKSASKIAHKPMVIETGN